MAYPDSDVVSPGAGISKHVRKLRHSCESCRSSKGRCIPSPDVRERCLRCIKNGKSCVFLEAKPRPKRAKTSRVRVAEMEEKLEGLLAILAAKQSNIITPVSDMSPAAEASPSMYTSESSGLDFEIDFLPEWPTTCTKQSLHHSYAVPMPHSIPDSAQDVIARGFIRTEQVEECLGVFTTRLSASPFVVLPTNMSLESLRGQRPFLLLAILCCTTDSDNLLQRQLELEFRESLGRRVFINGEKSLDLLQGLMVYLAWFHMFFAKSPDQIFQLCQLACSMVVDLGVDKSSPRPYPSEIDMLDMTRYGVQTKPTAAELEDARTFLGCFYITSSICQSLRKPNNLKYSVYMQTCAESLADAAISEHDELIPYFLVVRKLSDEVKHAFDYNSNSQLPILDSVRTERLVKYFEQQLAQIESTFPRDIWNNAHLMLQFHHLRIYVNEVGFHATAPLSENAPSSSWYYSSARNNCLLQSIDASKAYIDRYLALSDEVLLNLVIMDFLQLIYAMLILDSVSGCCDAPALDNARLRESAKLYHYLDTVSSRSLHIVVSAKPASNKYYEGVYFFFEKSKAWANIMVTDPLATVVPNFFFLDLVPTVITRCIDAPDPTPSLNPTLNDSGPEGPWTSMLPGWN